MPPKGRSHGRAAGRAGGGPWPVGPVPGRLKDDPDLSPCAAAWLKRSRGANVLDALRGETEMLVAQWTPPRRRPPAAQAP